LYICIINKKRFMEPKNKIDETIKNAEIGVVVARFQVHKLHEGHIKLIDTVIENHKKVIIFLGVPIIGNTKSNPLDYATREAMVKEVYPNVIVLPLKDKRSNEKWSNELDNLIQVPFGERSALSAVLYGSRDSFIPYYSGKYPVVEFTTDIIYSGTEVRKQVSKQILLSTDFRAGIIHATYAARPVTYPTVDITVYNDKGQILLAKKPNEPNYRFVGGFVDRTDESWEQAAKREFKEETGSNAEIDTPKYVCSSAIKDWRYANTESGIMTTLFISKFLWGRIEPSDDIFSLHWVDPFVIKENEIMVEHLGLFKNLLEYLKRNNTLENAKNEIPDAIKKAKEKYGESIA
jgi:bifunctional NMN adenylyltransferase/nudix hydrolase